MNTIDTNDMNVNYSGKTIDETYTPVAPTCYLYSYSLMDKHLARAFCGTENFPVNSMYQRVAWASGTL